MNLVEKVFNNAQGEQQTRLLTIYLPMDAQMLMSLLEVLAERYQVVVAGSAPDAIDLWGTRAELPAEEPTAPVEPVR